MDCPDDRAALTAQMLADVLSIKLYEVKSLALAALQDCGDLPAAREYHHEATLLATVAEALNLPPPRI